MAYHGRAIVLALRLHPDRHLRVHDEAAPEPGPGEAMIRVTAVGLCGSDRHWIVDGGIGDARLEAPLVLGHEFAAVAETGQYRGRLVAADPAVPCQRCGPCLRGAANLCLDLRFAGHGRTDGALREFVAWPERCLLPLSEAVSDAEAAIVEPLAVAVHAMDLAGSVDGATVSVVGCGPIGLLLVALARAGGASTVAATDPLRHRLDAATAFGATDVREATPSGDERAALLASIPGPGYDIAFDVSGEAAAVETAVQVTGPGATVVLVGIPSDDRTTFGASTARRKGLTLKLSRRSTPAAFQRAVELADGRSLGLERLVTLRVPLREATTGFDSLVARDGLKVIVEPGAGRGSP